MKYLFVHSAIFMAILSTISVAYQDIKIGFYSGTFDPPTLAHNMIIRTAINSLNLEKLYIFVNKNGEKDYKCSAKQRVEMVEQMTSDIREKIIIIHQSSDKKFQDYLLLKKIIQEPIVDITGQDSYERRLKIDSRTRINYDAIAIIPRTGTTTKIELEANAFFLPIDQRIIDNISSTLIRKKLAECDYKNIALHPLVLSYILEHEFYVYQPEKKTSFEYAFYAYMRKHCSNLSLPPFDPQTSIAAWEENFDKWLFRQKYKEIV